MIITSTRCSVLKNATNVAATENAIVDKLNNSFLEAELSKDPTTESLSLTNATIIRIIFFRVLHGRFAFRFHGIYYFCDRRRVFLASD